MKGIVWVSHIYSVYFNIHTVFMIEIIGKYCDLHLCKDETQRCVIGDMGVQLSLRRLCLDQVLVGLKHRPPTHGYPQILQLLEAMIPVTGVIQYSADVS